MIPYVTLPVNKDNMLYKRRCWNKLFNIRFQVHFGINIEAEGLKYFILK